MKRIIKMFCLLSICLYSVSSLCFADNLWVSKNNDDIHIYCTLQKHVVDIPHEQYLILELDFTKFFGENNHHVSIECIHVNIHSPQQYPYLKENEISFSSLGYTVKKSEISKEKIVVEFQLGKKGGTATLQLNKSPKSKIKNEVRRRQEENFYCEAVLIHNDPCNGHNVTWKTVDPLILPKAKVSPW